MDALDRIDVANPCTEAWEGMAGDDRVRFCGKCEQNVYRLTDLPRAEANELLARAQAGEEICVRYARRADGTVVTNDCPSQVQRGRGSLPHLLNTAKAIAAGLVATVGAGLSTGCFEEDHQTTGRMVTPATQTQQQPQGQGEAPEPAQPTPSEEVMGDMVCEPLPVLEPEAEPPATESEAVAKPQPVKRIMGKMRAPLPRDKKEQGLERLPMAQDAAQQEETK